MSCKKAKAFLKLEDWDAAEGVVDASKERQGKQEALELAKSVDKVVVAKGKNVITFHMKKDPPDDATLLDSIMGPTGNLRAPTIKRGKVLLVGFGEPAYQEVFGK